MCELLSSEITGQNHSHAMRSFSNVRVIVDCTELFVQTHRNQSSCFQIKVYCTDPSGTINSNDKNISHIGWQTKTINEKYC